MPFDVVVVGAAGVDTLVYVPDPVPDLTRDSTMAGVVDRVGQAGAFTSRGFARLGWRTGFVGLFGDDWAAAAVRSAFARDGVRIAAESLDPSGTARSVNLMTPDGRRRAFYDGRGHMSAPVPDAAAAFRGSRLALFHLSDWCRRLLTAARASGAAVATDLQDVTDVGDEYRADFVAASDIVFLSAANLRDPLEAAHEVLGMGPSVVVVGMGSQGAMAVTPTEVVQAAPPQLDLPIIDTNGAGDGLAVGFLHRWVLTGGDVSDASDPSEPSHADEALQLGAALTSGQCAARITCARTGSDDLATRDQLLELERAAAAGTTAPQE